MVDDVYTQTMNELKGEYQRIQRLLFNSPSKHRLQELIPTIETSLEKADRLYDGYKNKKQIDELVDDWDELLDSVRTSLSPTAQKILEEAVNSIP